MTEPPTRPLLRYLGGKWRLAPWIIGHFPAHRIYVEAFGGSFSVGLQKERAYNEVYNDLDDELVNLFEVIRGPAGPELVRQIRFTPYSRVEYLRAHRRTDDPVERARRLIIRSQMGHGNNATQMDRPKGFRSDGTQGKTRVAGEWGDFPSVLEAVIARFSGVSIEHKPAAKLIEYWNDPQVLLYLDPPYVPETRSTKARHGDGYHTYGHEMSIDDHHALLEQVQASKSMIVISGYPSEIYDKALKGWTRREGRARAYRNKPATEILWLNPACVAALEHGPLFNGAGANA
jgi:DNA adenine methylase